jgi:hypothetical protein
MHLRKLEKTHIADIAGKIIRAETRSEPTRRIESEITTAQRTASIRS